MTPEGVIAFPITPADTGGRVDVTSLRRLVGRAVEAGVDAVCVLGSTGSYAYLPREERRRTVEAAAAEVAGRIPLMAGVGALRTDAAVSLALDAAAAGADMGLLAPMSYIPLTDEEVLVHFEAVAAHGGLPLCIYDNPTATHFTIKDALVARLSAIRGVMGLKSPAPPRSEASARMEALRSCTPPGFSIGFSVDAHAPEALIAGGDAWYSVLGGLFPAPVVSIGRAVSRGDHQAARELNDRLEPVWELFRSYTGLRVIYAAANLIGICRAKPPRPILPLQPAAEARVAAVLDELGSLLHEGA